MSWSVSATGKVGAVAKKLSEDFARIHYEGSEGFVKDRISEAVARALENTEGAVRVFASGSFSGGKHNISLTFEPLYGFVE